MNKNIVIVPVHDIVLCAVPVGDWLCAWKAELRKSDLCTMYGYVHDQTVCFGPTRAVRVQETVPLINTIRTPIYHTRHNPQICTRYLKNVKSRQFTLYLSGDGGGGVMFPAPVCTWKLCVGGRTYIAKLVDNRICFWAQYSRIQLLTAEQCNVYVTVCSHHLSSRFFWVLKKVQCSSHNLLIRILGMSTGIQERVSDGGPKRCSIQLGDIQLSDLSGCNPGRDRTYSFPFMSRASSIIALRRCLSRRFNVFGRPDGYWHYCTPYMDFDACVGQLVACPMARPTTQRLGLLFRCDHDL